jgi:hypothetical protein
MIPIAKKPCTVTYTIEGEDVIIRFVGGATATAEPPKVNANGTPNKYGMVRHTGGFQHVSDDLKLSAFLMRKA